MQAVISPHIPEDKSPHRIGRRTKPSRLVGKSLTFIWRWKMFFLLSRRPGRDSSQPLKLSACVSLRVEATEEAQVRERPGPRL